MSKPRKSDLPLIESLVAQFDQHVRWAADAVTNPNLPDAERVSERRFHYGVAVGLNIAQVALGGTYRDAHDHIQGEIAKNRKADAEALANIYRGSK